MKQQKEELDRTIHENNLLRQHATYKSLTTNSSIQTPNRSELMMNSMSVDPHHSSMQQHRGDGIVSSPSATYFNSFTSGASPSPSEFSAFSTSKCYFNI